MQTNECHSTDIIAARITELQKMHVSLQQQLHHTQHQLERIIEDMALRIIDILDMVYLSMKSMEPTNETLLNSALFIKKMEKRLCDILRRIQVQEISFSEGRIETGKARVLETRSVPELPVGTIIEICRKGYQRHDKTIRPADVITTTNKAAPLQYKPD